jgi:hypothetical protein
MISVALFVVALLPQAQQPPAGRVVPQARTIVKDSAVIDTANGRRAGRRAPVTASLAATAFRDAATKTLVEKARRTRITQDSTLLNYDAITRQRMSVDLGIGNVGREHLFYRQESAARVQWQHDVGAYVDMTGARVGIPMAPKAAEIQNVLSDAARMSPIPYFPGYEALWIGGEGATARAEANERDIVNPLAVGSEAYYTFAIGDSIRFRLQDGTMISLREIEVRPRQPKWNLAVGSLWFDDNGQLVKAAYRLSTPIDMWTAIDEDQSSQGKDEVPAMVKGFFSPINAQITGVAIEYSLHGTHWLPRMRSMEGSAHVMFAHVPMQIDQRFEYRSVNGPDTLPRIDSTKLPPLIDQNGPGGASGNGRRPTRRQTDSTRQVNVGPVSITARTAPDSARQRRIDSSRAANRNDRESRNTRLEATADSIARGLPATGLAPGSQAARECDSTGVRTVYLRRFATSLPVAVRIPCDLNKLIHSPDLPPSIYDPGEEIFDTKDRDEMFSRALDMAAQAPVSLGHLPEPTLVWGLPMSRFNRVEGFSTGLEVDQELGGGYTAGGTVRFGFADKNPNVELTGARTNLTKTLRVTGYHHLVSASDWGNPLSFGSSFSALFFGKDEGFYYRATGGELTWTRGQLSKFEWRVFAEDERTAPTETEFAVFGRSTTDSAPDLVANEGRYYGAGLHFTHNHGLDPRSFRAFTDVRLEAAKGDSIYGRAAGEVTLSDGLPFRNAIGLTLSAGNSIGFLPAQRRWYLGGTQTVRGQSAEVAQNGNAYWLTRLELARDNPGHRSSVFGDLGWVGDRDHLDRVGLPLSGIGYGESMFDGIVRADLSYGLHPRKQLRFDIYLEARF